jgi:hypothetical protein
MRLPSDEVTRPSFMRRTVEPDQAAVGIAVQGMGDAEGTAWIAAKAQLRILPGMVGQGAVGSDANFHDVDRQGAQ